MSVVGASVGVTLGATLGALGVVVEDLPPLPIEIVIPRPQPKPREPSKRSNPRPSVPNTDGALGLLTRPQCSLVEQMAGTVDEMRQMLVDFGLRYYQVFSIVVRWSGGARHRGDAAVVAETPFLPVPKVDNIERVDRELRPAGSVKRGEIRLSQISPRYTADDILLLFPRELRDDEEHYIEVRGDQRDGATVRDRYVMAGKPERGPWGWSVRLTKADENRMRDGSPR
jgi:hypothetical protein